MRGEDYVPRTIVCVLAKLVTAHQEPEVYTTMLSSAAAVAMRPWAATARRLTVGILAKLFPVHFKINMPMSPLLCHILLLWLYFYRRMHMCH